MRVLVTGGSGFIGSHVIDRLRARNIDVRIFDMVMPPYRTDAEFYHGSLLNFEEVRMAMNGVSAVYHLAEVADVVQDPHYAESINTRGTMNVLEAARRGAIGRVIYGSTTSVYQSTDGDFLDEEASPRTVSDFYLATKIASEHYCQSYAHLFGIDATILRSGTSYGPRDQSSSILPRFVQAALRGEPLIINGDGSQTVNLTYVKDIAEGNVLALLPKAANKVYNLSSETCLTIREVAETVQRLIDNVEIEYVSSSDRDFPRKIISSKRAKDELGWEPGVPFEEGARRYIAWLREELTSREKDIVI